MWNDGDDRLERVLGKILQKDIDKYPLECPVCNEKSLNFYFIKRENRRNGGAWVWCSNCHNFTHGTVIVPSWWVNCESIDSKQLASLPLYQETQREIICKHIKGILWNSGGL